MVIFGFLAIVPLIMVFTGERMDEFAVTTMRLMITSFVIGIVGGVLSYAIPFTPRRERRIRKSCGELLQICADPARVPADMSVAIEQYAVAAASYLPPNDPSSVLVQHLVIIRARIARGIDVNTMEQKTDEILDRLNQLGKFEK
jgi:hypothetical protein